MANMQHGGNISGFRDRQSSGDLERKIQFRFLIPSRAATIIVGKENERIQRLSHMCNARLSIPDNKGPERVFLVEATVDDCIKIWVDCFPDLKNVMGSENKKVPIEMDLRFLCHSSIVGAIIGKGGTKVKDLRSTYQLSMIKVHCELAPKSSDRVIQIIGTPVNIFSCLRVIYKDLVLQSTRGPVNNYNADNFDEQMCHAYGGWRGESVVSFGLGRSSFKGQGDVSMHYEQPHLNQYRGSINTSQINNPSESKTNASLSFNQFEKAWNSNYVVSKDVSSTVNSVEEELNAARNINRLGDEMNISTHGNHHGDGYNSVPHANSYEGLKAVPQRDDFEEQWISFTQGNRYDEGKKEVAQTNKYDMEWSGPAQTKQDERGLNCPTQVSQPERGWNASPQGNEHERGWNAPARGDIYEKELNPQTQASQPERGWNSPTQGIQHERGWNALSQKNHHERGWNAPTQLNHPERGWNTPPQENNHERGWNAPQQENNHERGWNATQANKYDLDRSVVHRGNHYDEGRNNIPHTNKFNTVRGGGHQEEHYDNGRNQYGSGAIMPLMESYDNRDEFYQSPGSMQLLKPMNKRPRAWGNVNSSLEEYGGAQDKASLSINQTQNVNVDVTVPVDHILALQGSGGEKLNNIMKDSGAEIVVKGDGKGAHGTVRVLSIKGTKDQIEGAQYLMQMCVKRHMLSLTHG